MIKLNLDEALAQIVSFESKIEGLVKIIKGTANRMSEEGYSIEGDYLLEQINYVERGSSIYDMLLRDFIERGKLVETLKDRLWDAGICPECLSGSPTALIAEGTLYCQKCEQEDCDE